MGFESVQPAPKRAGRALANHGFGHCGDLFEQSDVLCLYLLLTPFFSPSFTLILIPLPNPEPPVTFKLLYFRFLQFVLFFFTHVILATQ